MNNISQTSKKQGQLTAARAALKAIGKSPRTIGEESKLKVIQWIYRWGYTSASSIQDLLDRTAAGFAQKLARQGWLRAINTESGTPKYYFTLTELGQQEAERHTEVLLRYPEIDPYRVDQQKIRHNLIAQNATIISMHSGLAVDYLSERMINQAGNKNGEKMPDVVWVTQSGLRIAVEVELSGKWERDLDQFILGIIQALQSSEGKPQRFDRFAIITESPAIKDRYFKAFKPGTPLPLWKKDKRKHWVIEKTIRVPDWVSSKIDFQLLEH